MIPTKLLSSRTQNLCFRLCCCLLLRQRMTSISKNACKAAMRSAASAILYEFPPKIMLSAPGLVFTTAFRMTSKRPQTSIWKSTVVSGRFSCLGCWERLGTTRNDYIETSLEKASTHQGPRGQRSNRRNMTYVNKISPA